MASKKRTKRRPARVTQNEADALWRAIDANGRHLAAIEAMCVQLVGLFGSLVKVSVLQTGEGQKR